VPPQSRAQHTASSERGGCALLQLLIGTTSLLLQSSVRRLHVRVLQRSAAAICSACVDNSAMLSLRPERNASVALAQPL
jgi:hypothetical protein